MSPASKKRFRLPPSSSFLAFILTLILVFNGCARITGNYPPARRKATCISARYLGEGFQLLAGSRLPIEQVEAELGQLQSQGFSRHDPQIIRSVAKRKEVPPGLLADRSGDAYYRFTAYVNPGITLALSPGALEVTLKTNGRTTQIRDCGFLLEDGSAPGGCRPPSQGILDLPAVVADKPVKMDFLVRLPVRGEIVGLNLIPLGCDVTRRPTLW
jgi:hypothetical protein